MCIFTVFPDFLLGTRRSCGFCQRSCVHRHCGADKISSLGSCFSLNKVVWSSWPGIQRGSKHRNLQHILFNGSRQCFYPGESSPESLSEAPRGLKYCLVVLKKSCFVLGDVMFALTLNPTLHLTHTESPHCSISPRHFSLN